MAIKIIGHLKEDEVLLSTFINRQNEMCVMIESNDIELNDALFCFDSKEDVEMFVNELNKLIQCHN